MKIVIDSNFFESPEILHIRTLLGRGSEILFIRLKCRLAEMPEEAILTLSPSEIERMAGWWGVPGKMCEAFQKAGIFSFRNGVFSLQDSEKDDTEKEKEAREKKEEKETEIEKEKDKKKKTIDKEKEERKAQQEKERELFTDLPDFDLFGNPLRTAEAGQTETRQKTTIYSPDFETFWQKYPRKAGKGAAYRSWKAHRPPLDLCLKALEWQRISGQWTRDGGQYVPHPATWINQERWLDEPQNDELRGNRAAAGKYSGLGEKV